ncbi:hypothetical protein [Brumimicrobium mesophilum]|uniref:hypothetical protein n=1 Tax=Brumimicrobium mesophilum TaxID=392717 RepID=UPI000D13F3E8|nr:hypothetical protein [Brumimicrobium mesophilum]
MKITLLFFLFPLFLLSQKKVPFSTLVSELNEDLTQYEKLSPFGEEYLSLKDFDLSRKERNELILVSDYDENLTKNKDSIAQYQMIFYLQDQILSKLDKVLKHPDFEKYDIDELIHDELSVVKSTDNKLFNFSLDEKTGGSYRSRFSIMHYTDLILADSIEIDPYLVFEGDGYDEIFMLETMEGVKYVLTGNIRGCSSCFHTFVQLINFEDNLFNLDFEYAVTNRDWKDGAYYDHETKTIEVSYQVDDLTQHCGCEEGSEVYFEFNPNESNLNEIFCGCKFIFNGKTFELIKDGWEKIDDQK